MSGFEAHLRRRLAAIDPAWGREWDEVIQDWELRKALKAVDGLGADRNLCLLLAVEHGWRKVTLLKDIDWERERLSKALGQLLNAKGAVAQRLFSSRPDRRAMLEDMKVTLRLGATGTDSGIVWTTSTTALRVSVTPLKEHQYTCLLLVDRHLRDATGRNRTRRALLAQLLGPFGLVPVASRNVDRLIEKWLERARRQVVPLDDFYGTYHSEHLQAGLNCTRACELAGLTRKGSSTARKGRS